VTDVDIGNLYRSRSAGSVTPRLDRRTNVFELKVKLKNLDTSSELTDAPEIELQKWCCIFWPDFNTAEEEYQS
jgi:hypothetical protein